MNLYIDFDGVILDTVRLYMDVLNEFKALTEEERTEILSNLDWDLLIEEADEINDSLINLKRISEDGRFNVKMLTHVNSDKEAISKKEFLKSKGIDVEVIDVHRPTMKSGAVNPINAILVDDDITNIIDWEEHGGIGIYFSKNTRNYPVYSIVSLDQLLSGEFNEDIKFKQ